MCILLKMLEADVLCKKGNKSVVPVLEQVLCLLKREYQMSTNCAYECTYERVCVCVRVSYLLNQRGEAPQPSATRWLQLRAFGHKAHQRSSGYSLALCPCG